MRGRPAPSWPVVLVALALALAGLATAGAVLLVGGSGSSEPAADRRDDLRAEALEAARTRTARLTSYDHETLDEDYAAVLAMATGPFKADYEKTSEQLRSTFVDTQAVAKGSVLAAGLEEFAPRRAVAVVAVDQVITTSGAAPRTERNRLRMVLVRPEDEWLVERVERL